MDLKIFEVKVSIHAPARGATVYVCRSQDDIKFQSTLPHGERHILLDAFRRDILVSIHAPARGAT